MRIGKKVLQARVGNCLETLELTVDEFEEMPETQDLIEETIAFLYSKYKTIKNMKEWDYEKEED